MQAQATEDVRLQEKLRRRHAYIVCASLTVSLVVFTLLLKASTIFIALDPRVWTTISGTLVILLGISMLVPSLWERVETRLHLSKTSHMFLQKARAKDNKTVSAILVGAALGPVFSSCSPTFVWLVAQVLPVSPLEGFIYLVLYCVGMAACLLAISLLGQRLTRHIRWVSDPTGPFQKIVGILFIVVGLAVLTGLDREIQSLWVSYGPTLLPFEETFVPR